MVAESTITTMHIQDIFQARLTTFSFEFFPPKTDKASNELFQTIADLVDSATLLCLRHVWRGRGGFDAAGEPTT